MATKKRRAAKRRAVDTRFDRRSLAECLIEARTPYYGEMRDPFRAWEAFWIAWHYRDADPTYSGGAATPEWVTSYFERVARRMIAISRKEQSGDRLAVSVIDALEINGRGRGEIFAKRKKLREAQQYAVDVLALIKKGAAREGKPYLAIDDVAKFHGVHRSTIERAWRQAKGRGAFLAPGGWEGGPSPSGGLPGRAPWIAPSSKRPD